MYGSIQIGDNPRNIKRYVEEYLEKIPEATLDAAYHAATEENDLNKKAVAAAMVLLEKILPEVIALAVHQNNGALVKPFDEINRALRRR